MIADCEHSKVLHLVNQLPAGVMINFWSILSGYLDKNHMYTVYYELNKF